MLQTALVLLNKNTLAVTDGKLKNKRLNIYNFTGVYIIRVNLKQYT